MRLETLLDDIEEQMTAKIRENKNMRVEDAAGTAEKVALAAVKYGDLSNQASKDYVFDTEKFISFEGNTGPYILYTLVRIKSILEKADPADRESKGAILPPKDDAEKALMLALTDFGGVVRDTWEELAPHKLCAYIYRLSNEFNRFYHGTPILSEEDADRRRSYLSVLELTGTVLEKSIGLLGFSAPEHM
jgi:arginyl-tRNA synthetase